MAESEYDKWKREQGRAPQAPRAPSAPSGSGSEYDKWKAAQGVGGRAKGEKKGFLGRAREDLSNLLTGIPRGVIELGREEAKTAPRRFLAGGPGGGLAEVVTGKRFDPLRALREGSLEAGVVDESGIPIMERARAVEPLAAGTAESIGNTVGRVRYPSRIPRDYSERPVSTAVEDVSNVLMVVAPVAKLGGLLAKASERAAAAGNTATAARLAKGAELTSKVEPLAHPLRSAAEAAGVPADIVAQPIRAPLRRLYVKAAEEADTAGVRGAAGQLLRDVRMDPESRLARRAALDPASEAVGEAVHTSVGTAQRIDKVLPDAAEREAMFVVGEGQGPALAALRQADPEGFTAYATERMGVSERAAQLAADVAEGTNPELATRIDEALRIGREAPGGRAERTASYLREGPASRREQMGFEPLSNVVEPQVARALRRLPQAERLAARLRQRADEAAARVGEIKADLTESYADKGRLAYGEGKRLGAAEKAAAVAERNAARAEQVAQRIRDRGAATRVAAEASVEAAPARLRPVLKVNREVRSQLTKIENDLRAQGLGGQAAEVGKLADGIAATLSDLKAQGVDPDHFIHIKLGDKPRRAGGDGRLPRVRKARSQKLREESVAFDRTTRAQAQAEIDEVRNTVARRTVDKLVEVGVARRIPATPTNLLGKVEVPEGWVVWEPTSIFETKSTAAVGDVMLPQNVFDHYRNYFNAGRWDDNVLVRGYDKATRAFKVAVLPLSPSWNVGNAFGNAMLATIGAGVDPVTLARNIGVALAEWKRTGEMPGPNRLFSAGGTHAEFAYLADAAPGTGALGKARRVAGAPARAGYRINEFVDDLGRSAVYMAKEAEAGGKGLVGARASEYALREALKAMGDFSRMTPFERSVVRRIVPFYAFQRHMTQLAFRLPIEHPLRTAWTLHLSDQYGQLPEDLQGLPSWMRGVIPFGSTLVGTSNLNPFGQAGELPTDLQSIASPLNPLIKMPIENLTGIKTLTGRPFSRPPGSGRVSEGGDVLPSAPSVPRQLWRMLPQGRAVDALTGRDDIVRYDTGDPVISGGRYIETGRSRGDAIAKLFGFSLTDAEAAKAAAARVEAKKEQNRKLAESYRRRAAAAARRGR